MEIDNPVGSVDNELYHQMNGDEKSEYLDGDGKFSGGEIKETHNDNRSNKEEGEELVESDKSAKTNDSARKGGSGVELVFFFQNEDSFFYFSSLS